MRALALALVLTIAAPAAATTVVELDAAGLRARADLVVRARVLDAAPRWVGQRIVTFHALEVVEVLAGSLSAQEARSRRVILGVPGGVVGPVGQRVPGAPAIEPGQEWVFYLGEGAGPGGARGVVGLFQGAFRLTRDPSGARLTPGSAHPGTPALPRDLDALRDSLRARP